MKTFFYLVCAGLSGIISFPVSANTQQASQKLTCIHSQQDFEQLPSLIEQSSQDPNKRNALTQINSFLVDMNDINNLLGTWKYDDKRWFVIQMRPSEGLMLRAHDSSFYRAELCSTGNPKDSLIVNVFDNEGQISRKIKIKPKEVRSVANKRDPNRLQIASKESSGFFVTLQKLPVLASGGNGTLSSTRDGAY